MKNLSIKIIVCALLLLFSKSMVSAAAALADQPEKKQDGIQELLMQPDAQYATPYAPELAITDQQKQYTVFVPQNFYVVLNAETKIQRAIVGPCCPCIMVAVRNEDTDTALVFHVPFDSHKYQKKLVSVVQKAFNLKSVKELHEWKVVLFSKSFEEASEALKEQSKWDQDKQAKGFDALKMCLQKTLNKHAKAVRIETMFFKGSACGLSKADHPEIEKTVAVDKNLRAVSVSLLSQGLYELMPPTKSESDVYKDFYKTVFDDYMHAFGKEKELNRIPDQEAGFEALKGRLKFVLKKTSHIKRKKS